MSAIDCFFLLFRTVRQINNTTDIMTISTTTANTTPGIK